MCTWNFQFCGFHKPPKNKQENPKIQNLLNQEIKIKKYLNLIKLKLFSKLCIGYKVLADLTLSLEDALLLAECWAERLATYGYIWVELNGKEKHELLPEAARRGWCTTDCVPESQFIGERIIVLLLLLFVALSLCHGLIVTRWVFEIFLHLQGHSFSCCFEKVLFGEYKINGFLEAPVVGIEFALEGFLSCDLHVVLGLAWLLLLALGLGVFFLRTWPVVCSEGWVSWLDCTCKAAGWWCGETFAIVDRCIVRVVLVCFLGDCRGHKKKRICSVFDQI